MQRHHGPAGCFDCGRGAEAGETLHRFLPATRPFLIWKSAARLTRSCRSPKQSYTQMPCFKSSRLYSFRLSNNTSLTLARYNHPHYLRLKCEQLPPAELLTRMLQKASVGSTGAAAPGLWQACCAAIAVRARVSLWDASVLMKLLAATSAGARLRAAGAAADCIRALLVHVNRRLESKEAVSPAFLRFTVLRIVQQNQSLVGQLLLVPFVSSRLSAGTDDSCLAGASQKPVAGSSTIIV